MRVLIVNFGTKRNLGCYALLEGTIALLRRACPKVEIRVLTSLDNDEVSGVGIVRSPLIPRPGLKGKVENLLVIFTVVAGVFIMNGRLLRGFYSRRFPGQRDLLEHYRWADVVVNTGGDVITEDYGTYSLSLNLFHLLLAVMIGNRVVFAGETIGPFRNPICRYWTLLLLRRSKLVLVRESMTENYLRSLGVSSSRLFRVPDPSLAIPSPSPNLAGRLQPQSNSRPRVCVVPSALAWRYFRGGSNGSSETYRRYIEFLAGLCEFFTKDAGGEVVLMPHVTGSPGPDDDLIICREVLKRVNDSSNIRIIDDVKTPQAVRRFLSECSFLVAFRMHAAIAGYATETPTVSIGYSAKFEGMAVDIMNSAEWFIDIRQFELDQQGVSSMLLRIRECWGSQSLAKTTLAKRMCRMSADLDDAVMKLKAGLCE